MKNIKLTTAFSRKMLPLALSVSALVGVSAVGSASAGVLATSLQRITGFTAYSANTGAVLDVSDFAALTFTSNADASADLNGTVESASQITNSANPIDLPITGTTNPPGNDLCVGDCGGYTNNDFETGHIPGDFTAPATLNISLADQLQTGSPITGLGQPLGAEASGLATTSLTTQSGDGSSDVNNGLSTTFLFTLSSNTAIRFDFDALSFLQAATDAAELFPGTAQAKQSFEFSITDQNTGLKVFDWNPDGTSGNINVGVNEIDPFDLNGSVARNAPFNGVSTPFGQPGGGFSGFFSAETLGLNALTPYILSLSANQNADIVRRVPEPSTIALLGLGFLGFSAARIRRRIRS